MRHAVGTVGMATWVAHMAMHMAHGMAHRWGVCTVRT